jgi:hypothetical protein
MAKLKKMDVTRLRKMDSKLKKMDGQVEEDGWPS